MRAPPAAVKRMYGHLSAIAARTPATNAAPTAMPIDPPMKAKSWTPTMTLWPSILPRALTSASRSPVGGAGGLQPVGVALGVLEPQRVLADLGRRQQLIFGGVEQLLEALGRADPVVEVAARADAVILFPFLDEHHRPALAALVPQVLGALALGQERDAAADAAQPAHVRFSLLRSRLAAISRIACAGSAAPVIGRPMTRTDAPSSSAWRGVTTRFWSRDVGARRADARDDEEAVRPGVARAADFGARADDAVDAGVARQAGEPRRPGRPASRRSPVAARSPASRLVSTVTATTFVPARRRGLGGRHHRPAAGGVDGQDRRLERRERLDRLGDGVGDVVELEVEEDRQAELGDARARRRGPLAREEFEAELHAAGMLAHGLARCAAARSSVGRVDGDEDRVHATGSPSRRRASGGSGGDARWRSSASIRRR